MTALVALPQFESDLLDIWLTIAVDRPSAADAMVDRIWERCRALIDHPQIGPSRVDIAEDCRQLTIGSYLVLYRIAGDAVELVRAVHGRRNLTTVFPEAG